MRVLLVFAGGGLGAAARYLTSTLVATRFGAIFPWGTLTVNVSGSFLIGLIATLADERGVIGAQPRLFLIVGVLGGFTTFSSFSLETLRLAEAGDLLPSLLNILANVALSLTAAVLGVAVGRL